MTTAKEKVKEVSAGIYKAIFSQVIIDLVEDYVFELLNSIPSRDEILAVAYKCNKLVQIYNPTLSLEIDFLKNLSISLSGWAEDNERINVILGIPKHN